MMTTYNRNDRQRLRYRLRRWQRLINYLLAALVLLALLQPAVASAAPACPGGRATPQGCIYQPGPRTVCAWPFHIVTVGRVTLCIRLAGEVQP